jgi:adenylate cyclase class 2
LNEVEIKFRVKDLEALAEKLRQLGFTLNTPRTHEMNTLYDFAGGELRRAGQLLRIRNYGGRWTVTHKAKGKAGRHKSRTETETPVADGEKLHAIFTALGLRPTFRYEKFRSEWSDGAGHVVVDETPIGNFAEIEGSPRWIDTTAKKVGVRRSDYITQNYASLFFAWKEKVRSEAQEMTFAAVDSAPAAAT